MIKPFLTELHSRNPVLSTIGYVNATFLVGALIGIVTGSTQVLGVNAWIKPAKFAVSIWIFTWTLSWLMAYLPNHRRAVSAISWGIAAAMIVEIVCISGQAYRGVASHFNFSTPIDGAIFGAMGIAILISTLLCVWVLILFFWQEPIRSVAYTWGIRLGILVFLAASYFGTVMVDRASHTVGADDGGIGLPFLNWSTQAGDIRVAHAIGLHALQLLPLIGFQIGRSGASVSRQRFAIWVTSAVYAGIVFGVYSQALAGKPLITAGAH